MGAEGALAQQTRAFLYAALLGLSLGLFYDILRALRLVLGAGTLYGALNALQEKGWSAPWGGDGGRKKEFLITGLGREAASGELARLRELTETAEDIIGGETEWKSGTVTSGPCWRPSPTG